jgi:hypothetical protein
MAYFKCPQCGKKLIPVWSTKGLTHICEWSSGGGCGYSVPSKELYAKSKKARSATGCKQRLRKDLENYNVLNADYRQEPDGTYHWYGTVTGRLEDFAVLLGGKVDGSHYTPPKESKNAPKL